MRVVADFHNHSCLSPCGSLELSPTVLVAEAAARGVQVLALSDHNSARNTPAFESLCHAAGLLPLCGIEVTTAEELHCLVLFGRSVEALAFGELIEAHTLKVKLRPDKHGDQVVVDEAENVTGEVDFWLGAPTDLGLTDLVELGHMHGGLVIPAHIDRPSQSVKSQLGYLPPADYDALEVRSDAAGLEVGGLSLVKGSDAHYPENVGSRTCLLEVESLSFEGVRSALRSGKVGR
ncbi:MAG: PHP domain-containing protein [Spirochaetales bacterium]